MNDSIKKALETKHAETKVVLDWITEIRAAMSEPKTDAEITAEKAIEGLFANARREEYEAYMATLETPDADEND